MLSIFLIPAALCFVFGRMVGDLRQGWAVLAAMTLVFVVAVIAATHGRAAGQPGARRAGRRPQASATQSGGNMEGKEVRFGINASALFATITTAASCGAVNSMHDSFTPLGGAVPLVMMQLGEVIFGGVGAGPVRHAGLRHHGGLHRRADDRPHARVPGQEDRGPRDEDGLDRHPGDAAAGAVRHRGGGARRARPRRHRQPRAARLLGSAVRAVLGRQQQRQRLRRPVGQHALLQRAAGAGDVVRPLRA